MFLSDCSLSRFQEMASRDPYSALQYLQVMDFYCLNYNTLTCTR